MNVSDKTDRILLLGSTGRLGREMTNYLKTAGFEVVTHGNKGSADHQLDVRVEGNLDTLLDKVSPDKIVNLIALTDVNLCESNPQLSEKINVWPTISIRDYVLSAPKQVSVVHISTDHVYGTSGPHLEDSAHPVNQYGIDKLKSEAFIRECNGSIIRTNFFGLGNVTSSPTFTDWIHNQLTLGNAINVHSNIQFNPLRLDSLIEEVCFILINSLPGVYNIGSSTSLTKYEFALKFAGLLGYSMELLLARPYYSDAISRPLDMRMNTSKYQKITGRFLPSLESEIEKEGLRYVTNFKSNIRD